ncbi:hypothetical protein ACFE04_012478 [Oxalis oulophora]
MAADNGEEKLIAVARHIAKTLGHNESMADDILQIFSTFDGRFSREKLSEKINSDSGGEDLRLESAVKCLERQISSYVAADQPIWSDSADSAAFLDAIDDLIHTINQWTPIAMAGEKSVGAYVERAEDLMQQAMFRLGDELRYLMERGGESFELLSRHGESGGGGNLSDSDSDDDGFIRNGDDDTEQIPVAQPVTEYDIMIDALPAATISDLSAIAKRMVAAGFSKECSHVYSICRREFLEESLSRLGLHKFSIEEVQKMPMQDVEDEIERWIKAANVALRILFPSERRLCDRVFFGFPSASASADLAFMEVCRSTTTQLLNFVDAIAIGSRSPERLFKVLDVFETLRDLIPEFETLFSDQYCMMLRNEAVTKWKRLGEAIRGIFMELEHLIQRDPAKAAVPGGGLHPITRYVMNYLRAACQSRQTLEQVFEESNVDRTMAGSLSLQMAWIMQLLESNLEMKSKIYKDPALCSIFLMNNARYIGQKVKDNELGSLLGDDWIRKHTMKVRQYHSSYQRTCWNKVLGILKVDSTSLPANAVAKTMREKLKSFNTHFDDISKTQSSWVVFDERLKQELQISLTKLVSPAYSHFIGRFQNLPEIGRNPERYIKYGVEDIEAAIGDLFQGSSNGSAGSRK